VSKLPQISGQECVTALGKFGFFVVRQRGSHIVLRRTDPFAQVVVPNHKQLDRGTLRSILRQAEIGVEDFTAVL
jgi:predicted RNA binding protein YcfA (HicA-like mRNA interferase family)